MLCNLTCKSIKTPLPLCRGATLNVSASVGASVLIMNWTFFNRRLKHTGSGIFWMLNNGTMVLHSSNMAATATTSSPPSISLAKNS